jgi:hypothetical protein
MIDFKMGRKCSTNGEANYLKNVDWKAWKKETFPET